MGMQADDNLGKVAQTAPVVLAKAVEMFLEDVLLNSLDIAINENNVKTINCIQIKHHIERNPSYLGFLDKLVADITEEKPKKRKQPSDSTRVHQNAKTTTRQA